MYISDPQRPAAAGLEKRRTEMATLAFGGWRHMLRKAKAVNLQQQNTGKMLSRQVNYVSINKILAAEVGGGGVARLAPPLPERQTMWA